MESGQGVGGIYIAGHRGMVGSAIHCALESADESNVLTATSKDLDLRNAAAVDEFFAAKRPTQVYLAAAKVGGIQANNAYPAEFIHDNLAIQDNVIHAAWRHGVERLLFLGSSCIYPRGARQPMREDALLTGPLELTNEPYAIAKIAGIKLCESYNRQYGTDFRSVMPTNLYGPGDNFDLETSHVLPALIRKCHEAKVTGAESVPVWGSGRPMREFLHVDDMAAACIHVMDLDRATWQAHTDSRCSHLNVGTGEDLSIGDLARVVADVVGFEGRLAFDPDLPDGTPRKLLDVSRLKGLGWQASIGLRKGIEQTYQWYLENRA